MTWKTQDPRIREARVVPEAPLRRNLVQVDSGGQTMVPGEIATFVMNVDGRLVGCHGWQSAGSLIVGPLMCGALVSETFVDTVARAVEELLRTCSDGEGLQVLSRVIPDATDVRRAYRLTMTAAQPGQRVLTIQDITPDEIIRRFNAHRQHAVAMLQVLTVREQQVMRMVIRGLPNKTIAIQLSLSIKTIEKYRGAIMRKLGLHSLCDLLRFWFRLAWSEELDTA